MLIESKRITTKDGRDVDLRSPTPENASVLLAHLRIVFRESYMNMNHPSGYFDAFTDEAEAKILTNFTASTDQFMISAFHEGRVIGNLGCFGASGEFLKHSARIGMGIEKQYCGSGLGFELLSYAIESAKRNGLHRLELTVRTFNEPGIRLYEKAGFERVGRLKHVAFIDGKFHDEFSYQLLL